MSEEIVKVDTSAIDELARDITKAKYELLGRLGVRGRTHLRDEVPVELGNLKDGVSWPVVDKQAMTATLTVSARSGASGGGVAQVMNADGKLVKNVTLRPSPAYNYAEVVARGNILPTLHPAHAKAFLIPVTVPPLKGQYLLIGGKPYIVRRSRKGQAPNPFDKRAAEKLEAEAPAIGKAVLEQFV